MIRLEDLVSEDEQILQYSIEGDYCRREFIAPVDKAPEYIDIAGCLEDTMHRILDEGGTPDDVYSIMGAIHPNAEEFHQMLDESENGDGYAFSIDLGYVIPDAMIGPITAKSEPEETR